MFHDYPYTDFHEMNLDYILRLARESMGLHLEVVGDKLQLKNAANQIISNVTVSYATKALQDADGNPIKSYIISTDTDTTSVIFIKGDGTRTSVTIPYATKAKEDNAGHDIVDYVINATVAGDKLRFVKGDGTVFEVTCPYATKASTDVNGKDLTTYAATLTSESKKLCLRDSQGRLLSQITAEYALEAQSAEEADLATNATNAIQSVTIDGNTIKFTTYGGTETVITCPYAVKANKDDLGNVIKTTYVASVVNDAQTGKLKFLDAMGNTIVELLPTVDKAAHDSYNNLIADYIKTIAVSAQSNYVTVTHGTGTVESLTIHYSEVAWKDTNGNVIKNTYVKRMEIEEDPANSNVFYIIAYNGDTPEAETFRMKLVTVSYDATNMDVNITFGGN